MNNNDENTINELHKWVHRFLRLLKKQRIFWKKMSVAVRVAQNIPKNATPLLLAAATFSSVQVYYSEKAHSQGRVPKLPKPAVKLPIVIPRNKFSYRRLLRVIKRLIEVVASLFPIVVSYLLKSTPIGETREQWLKRLVQTLANLGNYQAF